jgi:hypothetical protein
MTPKEIQDLYEQLKALGNADKVIWWPTDPIVIPVKKKSA